MYSAGLKGRGRLSNIGPGHRPQIKGNQEKNLWSSLLDSVASGKKLPEKNLLVLGGNPELQREFLETLESDTARRPQDRRRKKPPIANECALGYTYHDVLDADHDGNTEEAVTLSSAYRSQTFWLVFRSTSSPNLQLYTQPSSSPYLPPKLSARPLWSSSLTGQTRGHGLGKCEIG
ncbi:hypothetical protein XPA_009247 [Xanthoria parietina]